MTVQFGDAVRQARADAIETSIGVSAYLQLRSGAPPATAGAADSGTLLAEIALASDWMAAAGVSGANVTKAFNNLPIAFTGAAGAGTGTAIGHFRIKNNAKTVTGWQGTVTVTGGGGDITVDNVNIAQNQNGSITGYTWNEPQG